jgi:hypothetical protein
MKREAVVVNSLKVQRLGNSVEEMMGAYLPISIRWPLAQRPWGSRRLLLACLTT